jgi:ribosomal protein S18 acetylase RimI-like enzyme
MRFRTARPGDVDAVVPLIHGSSRSLIDATVGAGLVRRDFLRGRGLFGHRNQLVGIVDGEIVVTITAYAGGRANRLSLHTLVSALIHFRPAGLARALRRSAPLARLFSPPSGDAVFLANLCVAPSHRGLGYGTRAIEHASAGRPAELDVSASNVAAERLYGRLGFAVTGQRTAPGFDAFRRMRRER